MTKKHIFAGLVCLAVVTASTVWKQNRSTSIFSSRGLETAIREQINKPYGEITPEDCIGITELDLSFSDWNSDLEGIQYFVDLEILNCSAGRISDISALSNLTQLKELTLYKNNVRDISPLSDLINLEKLDLYDNNVCDLTPLANLTNLKHLVIGKNPIGDVEYINDGTNVAGYHVPDSFAPLATLDGLMIGSYADYSITVKNGTFVDSNMLINNEDVYDDLPKEVE